MFGQPGINCCSILDNFRKKSVGRVLAIVGACALFAGLPENDLPLTSPKARPPSFSHISVAVLRQNSIHLRFQQLRLSFSQPKISRSKFYPSVEGSLIMAS